MIWTRLSGLPSPRPGKDPGPSKPTVVSPAATPALRLLQQEPRRQARLPTATTSSRANPPSRARLPERISVRTRPTTSHLRALCAQCQPLGASKRGSRQRLGHSRSDGRLPVASFRFDPAHRAALFRMDQRAPSWGGGGLREGPPENGASLEARSSGAYPTQSRSTSGGVAPRAENPVGESSQNGLFARFTPVTERHSERLTFPYRVPIAPLFRTARRTVARKVFSPGPLDTANGGWWPQGESNPRRLARAVS